MELETAIETANNLPSLTRGFLARTSFLPEVRTIHCHIVSFGHACQQNDG
jgi:hypothetical protein